MWKPVHSNTFVIGVLSLVVLGPQLTRRPFVEVEVVQASAQSLLPTPPPPGWPENDCAAMGFPGWLPHTFQWQFSPSADLVNDPRHMHIELCMPPWKQGTVSGVLTLPLKLVFFHWEHSDAELVKVKLSLKDVPGSAILLTTAPGKPKGALSVPITEHLQTVFAAARIDTTQAQSDGQKQLVVGIHLSSEGSQGLFSSSGKPLRDSDLLTFECPLELANGGGRPVVSNGGNRCVAAGWRTTWRLREKNLGDGSIVLVPKEVNDFGYQVLTLRYDDGFPMLDDDPTPSWSFSGSLPRRRYPGTWSVFVNPDFHLHPPLFGTVLLNNLPFTSSMSVSTVERPPELTAGDRVMFRVMDERPGDPIGSSATLIGFTVGSRK